jgi:hypothetical protein
MVKHRTNRFFILYYVLFLVLTNKSFKHNLHSVELPIPNAANQVHLAEPSNRQAFAYFILFQPALAHVLETVKGSFASKNPLSN